MFPLQGYHTPYSNTLTSIYWTLLQARGPQCKWQYITNIYSKKKKNCRQKSQCNCPSNWRYERHSCQRSLMVDVCLTELSPGSVISPISPFRERSRAAHESVGQVPQQGHEGAETQSTEELTGSSAPRFFSKGCEDSPYRQRAVYVKLSFLYFTHSEAV